MRLFAAVVPPPGAVTALVAALGPHAAAPVRWTPVEQWHVTLAFLGDVPADRQAPLRTALAAVAGRVAPFALSLAGAGRFGDRVLWAGIGGDRPALAGLACEVADAARAAGVPPAGEDGYRPHLTLARTAPARSVPARRRTDLAPLVAALAGFGGPAWRVDAFRLVRSHPGPVYEDLAEWPLAGA